MVQYKLTLGIYLLLALIGGFFGVLYEDEFSMWPYAHITFILTIMIALLIDWEVGKLFLKTYLIIICLFGTIGFIMTLFLFIMKDDFDNYLRLGTSLYNALSGGLLFVYCDKYFLKRKE